MSEKTVDRDRWPPAGTAAVNYVRDLKSRPKSATAALPPALPLTLTLILILIPWIGREIS